MKAVLEVDGTGGSADICIDSASLFVMKDSAEIGSNSLEKQD